MGQKVNPHGLRVGIIKDWDAKWYAEKDFADNLVEDVKIRKFIKKRLYDAGISKITIERTAGRVKISVYTAKPGIVIGKNGASIEALKAELQKMTAQKVAVNIEEVKRPELDAQLVAENIALQLENRVTFRRAMKQAMGRTMKFGAKGIKTMVSGRLGGADIARGESYHEGTIPLQTLRAYRGNKVTYGDFGIMAMEPTWITSNQIEAARVAMTRHIKRGGDVWIKVFPDKPVSAKPIGTRMGSGKGAPEYWVAVVKPGRVMFEIGGVEEDKAREALRLAIHKLPIKCKIVSKAEAEEMAGEHQ